jgi:hypothetical protein
VIALLALSLVPFRTQGQVKPDLVLFDEDDSIGVGYYDASVGFVTTPSILKLGGPGDKMIIVTNQVYSGLQSGLLQWTSSRTGGWNLYVARPEFRTVDISAYSNLVLYVNSPKAITATNLPLIGLQSSPPDAQAQSLKLGDYLPEGLDADTNTWQRVSIPLTAFVPRANFSLSRLKDFYFGQSVADGTSHTIWFDNVRAVAGEGTSTNSTPPPAPKNVVSRVGDQSVVLHWGQDGASNLVGFHIYRALTTNDPLMRLTAAPVAVQSFADLQVTNGVTYFYSVRAINTTQQESDGSIPARATPRPFTNDDSFLDYVQQTAFDYFWYEANPLNGLIRDHSDPAAAASIAAIGFGLSGIGIAVDHAWISRADASARVQSTLRTLWEAPQGTNLTGTAGYKGWFYHFLDMDTAVRQANSELSSIDTALLLAGVLDAKQFFNRATSDETAIRLLADSIFNRMDWLWMMNRGNSLTHGWRPESGFIGNRWTGYSEAMILYLLGLGAATNPVPSTAWTAWTSTYTWQTVFGQSFIRFPPLFGHQYSHCWVDFRHNADSYMRAKDSTYFENSRRATLAQREYCIANPSHFAGYSSNVWGLTACDGPGIAPLLPYAARGAPPPLNDDGTIAPTAAGGSLPFAPEYCVPALRLFYDQFRTNIWTGYGFRDAFNLRAGWWSPNIFAIDQGPILLMAENYRSGQVWRRFMQNPEIHRGLLAAGFVDGQLAGPLAITRPTEDDAVSLRWTGVPLTEYWIEYSPDLRNWWISPATPAPVLVGGGVTFSWLDSGPPGTRAPPLTDSARFYRLFQAP